MTILQAIKAMAERDGWDQMVSTGAENIMLGKLYYECDGSDERDYSVQHDGIYMVKDGYLESVPVIKISV